MNSTRTSLLLMLLTPVLMLTPRQTACAYYDPGTQKWINRDPIAERGGLNVYAVVANSPIGLVDPVGYGTYDGHNDGCGTGTHCEPISAINLNLAGVYNCSGRCVPDAPAPPPAPSPVPPSPSPPPPVSPGPPVCQSPPPVPPPPPPLVPPIDPPPDDTPPPIYGPPIIFIGPPWRPVWPPPFWPPPGRGPAPRPSPAPCHGAWCPVS